MNTAILITVLIGLAALWVPALRQSRLWMAMVTPLASIIGSGFLILGPLLQASYGKFAPVIMVLLCGVAYMFGAAIRYSIRQQSETKNTPGPFIQKLEFTSEVVLGFAYIISVTYYLNLFGAFGTSLFWPDSVMAPRLLTSAMLILILVVGWSRGFKALERLEYLSVSLKLAIIGGLILGLLIFFLQKTGNSSLIFAPAKKVGWAGVTLAFGLLVTVQGFETSRYLGDEYTADERVRSMRWAQWGSSAIYLVYVVLLTYSFDVLPLPIAETAIIDLMAQVAPILPILLVIAALAAQFSAAIADTNGAGGLASELTHQKLCPKYAYLILVVSGLVLTWNANIFQIIAYASRAFAGYYMLQAMIAVRNAYAANHRWRGAGFSALALLGFAIMVFGQAAEG